MSERLSSQVVRLGMRLGEFLTAAFAHPEGALAQKLASSRLVWELLPRPPMTRQRPGPWNG
jgi:hypothetical protein